jgi:threonyl-tRNA synthetase
MQLKQAGYQVEIDKSGERLGKQIRSGELEKIPVLAVIGKREVSSQTLSIRTRKAGDLGSMTVADLLGKMQLAIASRTNL